LGAFKKANFAETTIDLLAGDMMVFYTDGIIEARNQSGQEMGYEGFAELVKKSRDADPQKVYQNIRNGYLAHISGMEAQDDLTILVICRSHEKP
jgi:serine phosphatase RsbU (regulator of sigma subunit)